MNIQNNNYNLNFGARRIVNVRKAVKDGADEVIDVFVLGKEDKKFMAKCLYTIKNAKGDHPVSRRNTIGVFQAFLSRALGRKSKDGLQFDDRNYLIAIKNGEMISGLVETSDVSYPTHVLESLKFFEKTDLVEDSLMYGLIKKLTGYLKGRQEARLFDVPKKVSKKVDGYSLYYKDFKSALAEIRSRNPQTKFTSVKDPYEYDLEDFLDIKDIETEVMV